MYKQILLILFLPLSCLSQKKEWWIDKPKEQWPQIALTNHVQYKNGDTYVDPSFTYAGTGFLIYNGKETLAATAKHVLWIAKNKKTKSVSINNDLKQWVMKPKENTIDSAVIDKLINEDSTEILEGSGASITERDWIIFSTKSASPNIYPLKPRYTPLLPDEQVYIISCAYNDSICGPFEGTLVRQEGMDLLIERKEKGNLPGSSGSPVIDANGYLVGIISSVFFDNKTAKNVVVAISTEYLNGVLNKKPNLNVPKKDYGELILKNVLESGTKSAIELYQSLASKPENYYSYNLRSTNRNGLLETGEKLMEMDRIEDAIEILKFNVAINSSFYRNYNLLAKAYLQAGNEAAAIENYKLSIEKNNNEEWNDAFKELAKLNDEGK